PDEYIFGRILPGAAISILFGNFFYAWQARRLARESGREDVTALPYGINTVSLFAFVFFIMLPIYLETKDPIRAWKVGLVACFLNGVIEILGAFIAEQVRRVTPRAALLSALSGIAITFIAMDFTFKIFARPLVALLPMALIFVAYFSHQRLPLGLPGGMVAIAVGTALGWALGPMHGAALVLGDFSHGHFQRGGLAAEHRERRGGGRSLQDVSLAHGQRYRLGGRGAFRERVSDHDLHRPPGLEAARRALRLFGAERRVHHVALFHRHDSERAGVDSARSRHRHS